MFTPVNLFKCLSDQTRLRCLLLLLQGELCVCDLTRALALSQPKISRHLAQLRASRVVADRRRGLWVYYRLHDQLPAWALAVLHAAAESMADDSLHKEDWVRLQGAEPACCGSHLFRSTHPYSGVRLQGAEPACCGPEPPAL